MAGNDWITCATGMAGMVLGLLQYHNCSIAGCDAYNAQLQHAKQTGIGADASAC